MCAQKATCLLAVQWPLPVPWVRIGPWLIRLGGAGLCAVATSSGLLTGRICSHRSGGTARWPDHSNRVFLGPSSQGKTGNRNKQIKP